jgi:hypothetical protein
MRYQHHRHIAIGKGLCIGSIIWQVIRLAWPLQQRFDRDLGGAANTAATAAEDPWLIHHLQPPIATPRKLFEWLIGNNSGWLGACNA